MRALWLNGTCGVGKTAAARRIAEVDDDWTLFDPEWVGSMLRANLPGLEFDDFQELASWRTLVPIVAREVATSLTARSLVVVQTVLVEQYWTELSRGMEREGFDVVHVVLDCDADVLRQRIAADEGETGAAGWRVGHVEDFLSARNWMTGAADLIVDTTARGPDEVAARILAAAKERGRWRSVSRSRHRLRPRGEGGRAGRPDEGDEHG